MEIDKIESRAHRVKDLLSKILCIGHVLVNIGKEVSEINDHLTLANIKAADYEKTIRSLNDELREMRSQRDRLLRGSAVASKE